MAGRIEGKAFGAGGSTATSVGRTHPNLNALGGTAFGHFEVAAFFAASNLPYVNPVQSLENFALSQHRISF